MSNLHRVPKNGALGPPISKILDVVRQATDPANTFDRLVRLGESTSPSPLWRSMPRPDSAADVESAATWLERSLAGDATSTGVYLGLDTLNMADRPQPEYSPPKNVEIGFSSGVDPDADDVDWCWDCERYGEDHLILSLRPIHDLLAAEADAGGQTRDVASVAEQMIFLGYSGAVLLAAMERSDLEVRERPLLLAWGFHDGDLYRLAVRRPDGGVERIAA